MNDDRTSISARVIADSTYGGSRLVTFEATFPRFVLAEFNTHRVLSRNSASSRAIPVWKRLVDVMEHPFVPLQFGKNKAGMQSSEEVSDIDRGIAKQNWLIGRDVAVLQAFMLAGGQDQIVKDSKENPKAIEVCESVLELAQEYPDLFSRIRVLSAGVHKQHANRVLEPYAFHTVITTASRWRNFFALRASSMAQPEIQDLAIAMATALRDSKTSNLSEGEWHLPYIFSQDYSEVSELPKLARISSARCARVSFLTHDGKRSLDADFSFADGLQGNGHMSPFEHPARTADSTGAYFGSYNGNFGDKWIQFRKTLLGESDFSEFIKPEDVLDGMKGDQSLVDFVLSLPE